MKTASYQSPLAYSSAKRAGKTLEFLVEKTSISDVRKQTNSFYSISKPKQNGQCWTKIVKPPVNHEI